LRNHLDFLQGSSREITDIAKGAGVVFFGTIMGMSLRYLFRVVIGRFLGPALVGLFFIGLGAFRIAEKIACLGIQNGVLRYGALYRGEGDAQRVKGTIVLALRFVILTGVGTGSVLALLSPVIAVKVYHEPGLTDMLRLFSLAVPFSALTTIFLFSTQSFRIMKYKVAVREILEPIFQILFFIVLFVLGFGLYGAVYAYITALVIGTGLAFFSLVRLFPDLLRKALRPVFEAKKLLTFSWPLFFVGFFYLIILWLNTLLIGFFMSSEDVGIFGAAHNTAMLGQVVLIAFVSIFAPIVSDLHNRRQFKKLEGLYKVVTKWIFLISFPIFILMVSFSRQILDVSFGKDFVPGANVLELLSVGLLANSIIGSAGFLTSMSGRPKIELFNLTVVLALNIFLSFLLIPRLGLIGAAYSTLAAFISLNILRILEVLFLFKMHPFRLDLYKPVLAGGVALAAMKAGHRFIWPAGGSWTTLAASGFVFLLSYIVVLFVLGFEEEDRIVFSRIKEKTQIRL